MTHNADERVSDLPPIECIEMEDWSKLLALAALAPARALEPRDASTGGER